MRQINRDSLPHLVNISVRMATVYWCTAWARLAAKWWGVHLGQRCKFAGKTFFRRHPNSYITIGHDCEFMSRFASNLIGLHRPCIISTLKENAGVNIGDRCGFSGTVIGCAAKITLGKDVRCGANTLITDTDWHSDDARTGSDSAVTIERNVWLSVNVTVLKGVTIGENTVVAAGSVVTKSLPPNVIAAGIPAKVIRQL